MILASRFLKCDLRTVMVILWKSEKPVPIKAHDINCFFLLVDIKPIKDSLLGFLKQVDPFVRFLKL